MPEAENGVIPERFQVEAGEILAEGIDHIDRALRQQSLHARNEDILIIGVRDAPMRLKAQFALRQTFHLSKHCRLP